MTDTNQPLHQHTASANSSHGDRTREIQSPTSKLSNDVARRIYKERRLEFTPATIFSEDPTAECIQSRVLSAQDRLSRMGVRCPTEEMLAIHMINTHEIYTDCNRRAVISIQNPVLFEYHLRNMEKLSNLYMKQLAAWDKHRGRGKQQVRVEHVNVAAGGQAIVGKLDVRQGDNRSNQSSS